MIRLALCRAVAAAAVSTCLVPVACAEPASNADDSMSSADDGGLSVQVNATANCPTSVSVNKSVALKSGARFNLTNDSGTARTVLIVEEISDDQGHTERTERSVRIPARGSISDRTTPRVVVRATYSTPG